MKTKVQDDYFSFQKASSDENHETYGMGPCIAVGIYDKISGDSYITHMPLMQKDFEEEIKEIKENVNYSKTFVYACGGGLDSYNSEEASSATLESRKTVKEALYDTFKKENIEIHWNKLDQQSNLFIDKKKKKMFHTIEDIVLPEAPLDDFY